jgi:hypothetical protein
MSTKIKNPMVADTFKSYPPVFKKKLIELRSLIFKTAKESIPDELLVEALKWGEPSYLWHKKNKFHLSRLRLFLFQYEIGGTFA